MEQQGVRDNGDSLTCVEPLCEAYGGHSSTLRWHMHTRSIGVSSDGTPFGVAFEDDLGGWVVDLELAYGLKLLQAEKAREIVAALQAAIAELDALADTKG